MASRTLRRLAPRQCRCMSQNMAQTASASPVPASRSFYSNAETPKRTSQAAPLRARPRTDRAERRSLFNLAAALGQAASSSGGPQQSITTVRILPYAAGDLFRIIANVDAYAKFLPHCTRSHVTQWRNTPSLRDGSSSSSWPARADLTVGWGPLSQTYSSRVYCVPSHGVVEAVSGRAGAPTLTAAEREEIGLDTTEDEDGRRLGAQTATDDDTFESLVTRWTVVPLKAASRDGAAAGPAAGPEAGPAAQPPKTKVELHIRFQFRNPLYQMAAAQVGNEMATKMIEAFEMRAAELLGRRL